MATQTKQVDLILRQHARVSGTVRGVANHAAFDFRLMLINERSLLLGVAFVADFISSRIAAELLRPEGTVGIMAVVALDEAFIDAVMERSREFSANVHVAFIAKLG